MIRRLFLFISAGLAIFSMGCTKETYDMNKLSKVIHLSPVIAVSAVSGDVSFSDMVKSNDTLVFGSDKLVKIIIREDSVVDLKMADFYDVSDLFTMNRNYTLGDLVIDQFQSQTFYTLNEISLGLSPSLRAQLIAYDDGLQHLFPAFPAVTLVEKALPAFTNFETAVFRSGFIDISVKNNLTTPLNGVSVKIFNTAGHVQLGAEALVPAIPAGQTRTVSVDLTNKTVSNTISVAVILSGSPGTTSPVLIDLDNSSVQLIVTGRDLKVKSGRVILPPQSVTSFQSKDTVTIVPGGGYEMDELKITSGNLEYSIKSAAPLKVTMNIRLPEVRRAGIPVTESVVVNPNSTKTGLISVNNTLLDLGTDIKHPYNRVPMENSLALSSDGALVTFNSEDAITMTMKMINPAYDYLKGYFGQSSRAFLPDSIDTGFSDLMENISGSFVLADPVMRINYTNSFSIPVRLTLDAYGRKDPEIIQLGFLPVILDYPVAPAERKISSSLSVDRKNSSISPLLSMPPEVFHYSGKVEMNPSGNSGLRNNYIFPDSRLTASIEMEVPFNFRTANLQFTDTLDNFLKDDNSSGDNSLKPEDIKLLRLDLFAENGFPMGTSVKMSLYDSATHSVKSTIDAADILKPAPVDTDGKAKGSTQTKTSIEFTGDFFKYINKSDKIIFRFTLKTTDNGTRDVKIYSDYRIKFSAALVLKPDITFH